MNLTSELDAVKRFYQAVQTQKAALAIAEEELRRRIAEHEEKRFGLLVERAVAAGKGWCTICHGISPLDELCVEVWQNSLYALCQTCGKSSSYRLRKINGRLVAASTKSTYDLGEVVEVGIMHQCSRRHISDKSIPPKLATEFIPDVPEIQLAADGTFTVGGKPYVPSAE